MDPLSITASAIALLTLAKGCTKVLAGLQAALGSTSQEISALINEVSDIKALLSQAASLSQRQPVADTGEGPLLALRSQIGRAAEQLQMLHDLIQKASPAARNKSWDKAKAQVFFLRNKERILNMQADLCKARLNLGIALGIIHSSTLTRVELQVHAISAQQNTDARVLTALLSQVSMLQHKNDPSKDLQLFPHSTITKLIENNVSSTSHPSDFSAEHNSSGSFSRAISANLSVSIFGTPELTLRIPRMVSWVAPIWHPTRIGDQMQIAILFSEGKASPYDVNAYGQSPLHYAIRYKHWPLARFLIDQGADVMLQDENGRKPIDTAWESILSKTVTNKEADLVMNIFNDSDYLTSREFTPLHKMVLGLVRGSLSDELSISTKGINAVDANGRTSLSWAAARGDHKVSQALLHAGADPRIPDHEGISPLLYAIKRSDVAGTRLLISHGADVTKREVYGGTALHAACVDYDNPELIELLVSANVDVNAMDFDGDTALHYTAWGSFHKSTAKLLELNADPYVRNVAGDNVIHMAIYHRSPAVLSVLAKHGVRMDTMTMQGHTVLHSACETPDAEILRVLAAADLRSVDLEAIDKRGKRYVDCFKDRADENDEVLREALMSLVQHVQSIAQRRKKLDKPLEGYKDEGQQEEMAEIFYDVLELA
ncbi:hypothetical protein MY4038_010161 [Beauveria bassiana]